MNACTVARDRFDLFVRAVLVALVMISLLFPECLSASTGWRRYEGMGDKKAALKLWSQAKTYYLRAVRIAGRTAPKRLWDKYNRAYYQVLQQQIARAHAQQRNAHASRPSGQVKETAEGTASEEPGDSRAAPDGDGATVSEEPVAKSAGDLNSAGIHESESRSTHASSSTTGAAEARRPVIVVNEDGTLRLNVAGGLTRMGTSGAPSVSSGPETGHRGRHSEEDKDSPVGLTPTSTWGQRLADRSGGRTVFDPSEKVGLDVVQSSAWAAQTRGTHSVESSVIESLEFKVFDIQFVFRRSNELLVKGRLLNKTDHPFKTPRVYVRLYNDTGVFKARSFGYLKPGRNVLNPGKAKDFTVRFMGFRGTVGSFKVEVMTNLNR